MNKGSTGRRSLGVGFSVISEFEVRPECFDAFIDLALALSDECIESEDGCWQFDVIAIEAPASGVLFYEAYDGITAFERHCQSAHFARFRAAFGALVIAERPLRQGSRCRLPAAPG